MVSNINAHPASQEGGDKDAWQLRLLRAGFRTLSAVHAPWAEGLAARMFMTPRRHPVPEREQAALANARHETLELEEGRALSTHVWEPEGADPHTPAVMLTHGWEGRGSQLYAFAAPLVAAGRRVVTFDHLGHGESSGKRSSLIRMQEGQLAIGAAYGPFEGLCAHSMGGAAAVMALDHGLAVERVAFVATPWDMHRYLERYAELVTGVEGLSGGVVRRLEERYDVTLAETLMSNLAPRRREPLLVVQDEDDRDVPLEDAHHLQGAWHGAQLQVTRGLGHRRIVRDPDVVRAVVGHLCR